MKKEKTVFISHLSAKPQPLYSSIETELKVWENKFQFMNRKWNNRINRSRKKFMISLSLPSLTRTIFGIIKLDHILQKNTYVQLFIVSSLTKYLKLNLIKDLFENTSDRDGLNFENVSHAVFSLKGWKAVIQASLSWGLSSLGFWLLEEGMKINVIGAFSSMSLDGELFHCHWKGSGQRWEWALAINWATQKSWPKALSGSMELKLCTIS